MTTDSTTLVLDFCAAFSRRDVEEILAYFTDDAVYHNMPVAPATGTAAIRNVLQMFLGQATFAEFEVLNIAASGDVVLTERMDRFEIGGKRIELPVMGAFEVKAGKIAAWRDYFDMAAWTRQTS
jgi:limonene-1,2-epoxide hydrolase